jgi:hypothetical protein
LVNAAKKEAYSGINLTVRNFSCGGRRAMLRPESALRKGRLDSCFIIFHRAWGSFPLYPSRGRRKPMKNAVRTSILMFGLVGAMATTAVPQVPAPDGGPIPVCPPQQQLNEKCEVIPPAM